VPVWNLNGGEHDKTAAQQIYTSAIEQILDSNYTAAKSTLQQVVLLYAEEEPATSAMKAILYLEPFAGNNFTELKNWYLTESVILNHEPLLNLSQKLATVCDEKIENYQDAIQQYESIIENPVTIEDSIFAIIDLEHLYWQMGIDTNLRSNAYTGRLTQFKPKSFKAFKDHKDELLVLLLDGKKNSGNDNNTNDDFSLINTNRLIHNTPNPFSDKTDIHFNLNTEKIVTIVIKIFDHYGKEVLQMNIKQVKSGHNKIELNMQGMPVGIYYYSLIINGSPVDTRKRVLIK
jgi:hypothetical protein